MSLDHETMQGPRGQVASRTLMENRRRLEPEAIPITHTLFCVVGVNICNTQLVLTPEGVVVVDTGRSSADGEAILEIVDSVSDKPVIAVIYSHSLYTFGTTVILDRYPGIPVIAHHRVHGNITRSATGVRRFMTRRGRMESARYLPASGPDADAIDRRIETPGSMGYVRPTIELTDAVTTMTLGGASFTFHTTYTFDTDDTLLIWYEDQRAIMHNHFSDNFPNVYPIQGGPYRDPLPWLDGIDRMRDYRPHHLLSTHGVPTSGVDACMERLTLMRDALQFVHDQTIRGMNRHLEPEAIVDFVQLPEALRVAPELTQTYGIVANHVRGVYAGLAGRFDGSAASIYAPPPQEEAACLIRDLGGVEAAATAVRTAISRGEHRWAVHLARRLYRHTPDAPGVRSLYASLLRHFGRHTTAWTIRNYYLSEARIVEGNLRTDEPERTIDVEMALLTEAGTFVRSLGYRANPDTFPDTPVTCRVEFVDTQFECTIILRNGVMEYRDAPDRCGCDYAIRCARRTWIEAADSIKPFALIVDRDGVDCLPSREALRALLAAFD